MSSLSIRPQKSFCVTYISFTTYINYENHLTLQWSSQPTAWDCPRESLSILRIFHHKARNQRTLLTRKSATRREKAYRNALSSRPQRATEIVPQPMSTVR
ncbi:hypothetical protein H2248_009616 [Termitomyces sp. 'cryptogamus']|nr:hypothetical protein H2248_009616 [Termitomyces sp. 'cryptogamus']